MYTAYFGFQENPFHVTPNPRFLYTTPTYQEVYASLLAGIRNRKGFLVLTGEVGTGKTTLLRRLMAEFEATASFAFLYNTALAFDDLLSIICEDFGFPVKGEGGQQKIQVLREFLLAQWQAGRPVAVLIDEAQNLEDEALEGLQLLLDLKLTDKPLLQLVLVGQPELEEKLSRPQFRHLTQRISVHCQLHCLKEKEVGPFIHYRLQVAGYTRQDLFPSEAIRRIAQYSQGIPRLVNIICDNALLIAYVALQKAVSTGIIEEVAYDLGLKEGSGFVEGKNGVRVTPPHVPDLLLHEAALPPLAKPVRVFNWARFFSNLILLILVATGLLIYMMPVPAPVPPVLQSPAITQPTSPIASPEQENVTAAVEGKGLASESETESLDTGPLPPIQTAERGEMIFKSIAQRYPKVRPFVWGLVTKSPQVAIFLPEAAWTKLAKEDQVSLTLYVEGLVPLIRTNPDEYVDVARTDPRYKTFRTKIAKLCTDCWAIGVGRPTLDEKGVLFEQIVVQGDSMWEKSAPQSEGVKASEFRQGVHFVALEEPIPAPVPPVVTQAHPLVKPGQEIIVTEGESLAFSIDAESPQKSLLRYTWQINGRQRGKGKTWTYQPDFDEGSAKFKEVKVLITDQSNLTAERVWKVRVTDANRPPRIAAASPQEDALEVTSGDHRAFSVHAADPDKDDKLVYTWFLNGQEVARGPQWEFRMPSTPSSHTRHQVKVEVSDKGGLKDQRAWNVVPHISPPPPLMLSDTEAQTWLAAYRQAWEAKNIDELVELGAVSDQDVDKVREILSEYHSLNIVLKDVDIRNEGNRAVITFSRVDTINGQTMVHPGRKVFTIEKAANGRLTAQLK